MSYLVTFNYIDVWGSPKIHFFDYVSRENISDIVFDGSFDEANNWFENELRSMVDDCEKFVSWDIS